MPASGKLAIPLIHDSKPYNGILTDRQQTWVSCATNDNITENPVIYRHKAKEELRKEKISETEAETVKVRGLPEDVTDNPKSSAGLIEKLQQSRRERHDSAFEDMIQELAAISFDLEPQISEICRTIKGYLDMDLKEMEFEMSILEVDESLLILSMKDLNGLWRKIEARAPQRKTWIEGLDKTIQKVERNRAFLISEVFKAYKVTLENIAHMMPADVQRLMENEIVKTNKFILNNKKCIADLIARLLIGDIDLQRRFYIKWQNRCADWKTLKLKEAIQNHKVYMESELVVNPPLINRLLSDLSFKQKSINKRRLDLLTQLRNMKPPISTKTAVYQWNCALTIITDELDSTNSKFIFDVKSEQNRILKDCDDYIINLKDKLLNGKIVNSDVIDELFEDTFLPLVGERKALFEYQSEKFEKHISEVSASQKLQFKSLFKYTQGIAHIWDIHEIGLTKEERQLQEMLDKNRREHDYQNQIKEAKLDIVMDRMRQDSSREALNGSLHQSLNMMEGIKKGYLEFHKQQRGLIEKYPKMIKEEVKRYATSMCSFFNAAEQGSKEYAEYAKFVKVLYSEELSNGVIYDILEPPDMDLPSTTASGGRSSPLSTKTFLTDLDDLDVERERMPYVESFALSPNLFEEYKKNICKEFLEHLQLWEEDSKTKAESIMMAKIEETNNELDLRLHLHDPRPGRAEKDVHDVRLTELTAHQDRVDQHCAGVLEALESIKRSYQDMSFGHLQENDKFRKSVEELEVSFTAASNTHELKAMQEEVHGKLDQFNEIIRASIRQFRNTLDTTLNKLRGSNAQFRKSLKIFSVGGNFSPEEVDEFRKRLERMASKIDHCEGNVTGELEGLENKRLEVAKENAGKLEDRFKHHLFDMTFIEKIKRWLTNIQVKIKAEVANSNSQGQHLSKMISVFNTKLKLIKNPQVDSEKFTASEAYETLIPILKEFRNRVKYLNCAVKKERVAVVIPTTVDTLVKTTLEKQREKAAMRGARNKRLPLQQKSSKLGGKGKKTSNLAQMAQLVQGGALSAASKQVLTATPKTAVASKSPLPPPPSETPSSATNDGGETAPSTPAPPKPTTAGYSMRRNSGVRTSLGGKYDKKYLAFGDPSQEPEKPDKHFLALQIKILQSGLDGLLSSAEHYYRQKGTRHPTRPKVINDTFDLCAESVIGRLRKYKTQTESYHNDCIQEFRAQIKLFNGIMIELPSLLMISLITKHQNTRSNAQKDISNTLQSKIEISERLKKEHQTLLRPTLGHPNNKPELDKLKSSEKSRQKESEKSLDDYQKLMLDCINMSVRSFVIELNEKVNTLLSQFDVALTLDEVIIGDPKMKPKAEKELLRENQKQRKQEESEKQNQQQNLSKNEDQFETPTPHYWPKLDTSSLIESGILKATDFLTIPNSMKQTEAHKAVIKARDEEFQHFLDNQSLEREELKKSCDVIRNENERWKNNWKTSIKKITQLY